MAEQDQRISEVVTREQIRLRNFIRRRVPDPADVEDIVQEVFYELVEANRLLMPIDHVTGWLFRVARNRITDFFRARTPEQLELEEPAAVARGRARGGIRPHRAARRARAGDRRAAGGPARRVHRPRTGRA